MTKKKVLFVIESLSGGGAEMVLNTLVQNFDYSRYDVTVCSLVDVGKYNEAVKQKCHYRYVIPDVTGKPLLLRLWWSLIYHLLYYWLPTSLACRLFIPKGYDTYVAFVEGFVTKLLSKVKESLNPKPYTINLISWVHCDLKEYPWPTDTKVFKSLEEEKEAYGKYDHIAVVSESSKNHFIEIFGLADRTQCIYNPIDKKDILSKAALADKHEHQSFRFISVGRLEEPKGYDRLIEAFARLHQEYPDTELWIVGEGSQREKLRDQSLEPFEPSEAIEPLNPEHNCVRFLGFQFNPYQFMNQCDCFVCSSRTEGYSLVIAEAMTVGLPVISTRCAGPEEILEGGKWGLMVDNSTEGLYDGMKQMLQAGMTEKYKALSAERAKSFDMSKTLAEICNIL